MHARGLTRSATFVKLATYLLCVVVAFAAGWAVRSTTLSIRAGDNHAASAAVSSFRSALCPDGRRITIALVRHSGWTLCWAVDPRVGLQLTNVQFSPSPGTSDPILASGSLAQVDVRYDDGRSEYEDLPGFGVLTRPMRRPECLNGTLFGLGLRADLLCAQDQKIARAQWNDYEFGTGPHFILGECASVSTETPVDWYTYVERWTFCEDGSVHAAIGVSGQLSPHAYTNDPRLGSPAGRGQLNVNHYHAAFWRIVPDLGASTQQVSLIESLHNNQRVSEHVKQLRTESAVSVGTNTILRIGGTTRTPGAPMPQYRAFFHSDGAYRPASTAPDGFLGDDLYVTDFHECEQLASHNRVRHSKCGNTVRDFVNGESLARPVLWIQTSFHHLPGMHDRPIVAEHWLTLDLDPM